LSDTHQWTITISDQTICSEYQTETECINNHCYWYNKGCHGFKVCENINNEIDCIANRCHWCDGHCQTNPCDGDNNMLIYAVAIGLGVIGVGMFLKNRTPKSDKNKKVGGK